MAAPVLWSVDRKRSREFAMAAETSAIESPP